MNTRSSYLQTQCLNTNKTLIRSKSRFSMVPEMFTSDNALDRQTVGPNLLFSGSVIEICIYATTTTRKNAFLPTVPRFHNKKFQIFKYTTMNNKMFTKPTE